MAGLITAAEQAGAKVDLLVFGTARPARAVDEDAFEAMTAALCDALSKGGFDGLLLEMHGAMVTSHLDDGEGEILRRIRQIDPNLPVAVALDFHGNLSPVTIESATTLVGYKTFPHLDIVETGYKAGELLMRTLRGEIRPTLAYDHCGVVPNMLRQATSEGVMAEIMAMARAEEDAGALDVSVFGGFSLADCPFTGISVVATTDGDHDAAQAICARIREAVWERREAFQSELEPLATTIARAKALGETEQTGPILLVDTADNCHSGGTQDSMDVIAEALKQRLTGIVAGPISDRAAVARMIEAGVGAEIELPVGGGTDFTAIGGSVGALRLRGRVRTICDGKFEVRGPVFTGMPIDLGRTVVLETAEMTLLVSENRCEPLDLANFTFAGVDPRAARYLIIKSKIQYRPTFGQIASHILNCYGVGFATLDLGRFRYERVSRPLYPFDQ